MTNQQRPITPPPELLNKWLEQCLTSRELATQAARWGADQELEACCEVLDSWGVYGVDGLRAARRPKPLSLKEEALSIIEHAKDGWAPLPDDWNTIIRALEQLPNE